MIASTERRLARHQGLPAAHHRSGSGRLVILIISTSRAARHPEHRALQRGQHGVLGLAMTWTTAVRPHIRSPGHSVPPYQRAPTMIDN